jgi:hypothetical protein
VERVSGRAQESMSVEKFVPMEIIIFLPPLSASVLCIICIALAVSGRGFKRNQALGALARWPYSARDITNRL